MGRELIVITLIYSLSPNPFQSIQYQRLGYGKTTLLKILSGLIRPDEGKVTYTYSDGRVISDPAEASPYIAYVGEDVRFPNIEVTQILESFPQRGKR